MSEARLTEAAFERLADQELHELLEALVDCGEEVDPDLQSGVLTLEFEDGSQFVVNSHRAARQIWMAAEQTAWHFDYQRSTTRWIAIQTGVELRAELSAAMSRKLGTTVKLAVTV